MIIYLKASVDWGVFWHDDFILKSVSLAFSFRHDDYILKSVSRRYFLRGGFHSHPFLSSDSSPTLEQGEAHTQTSVCMVPKDPKGLNELKEAIHSP